MWVESQQTTGSCSVSYMLVLCCRDAFLPWLTRIRRQKTSKSFPQNNHVYSYTEATQRATERRRAILSCTIGIAVHVVLLAVSKVVQRLGVPTCFQQNSKTATAGSFVRAYATSKRTKLFMSGVPYLTVLTWMTSVVRDPPHVCRLLLVYWRGIASTQANPNGVVFFEAVSKTPGPSGIGTLCTDIITPYSHQQTSLDSYFATGGSHVLSHPHLLGES